MTAPMARGDRAQSTAYFQFEEVRQARSTLWGDQTTDVNTGASPVTRWLAYAMDYADRVSNTAGTAWVIQCLVPEGSFVYDCVVRLDQAFDGTGANSVEIGDSNQASGWAAAQDLTQDPGTTPIWIRDNDAVYTNRASDISQGATGGQYYQNGGVVEVVLATTLPTQGRAVLFLRTISYNEPQNSEWTTFPYR